MSAHANRQRFLAETHDVLNQAPALQDYNPYQSDTALREAVARGEAAWADSSLSEFGALTGSAEFVDLGFQANDNRPALHTHDRHGRRIDEVRFHPAYHRLMQTSLSHGLHSSQWTEPGAGAHVARAARFYLMTQVEAGHLCPITMTSAVIPALRHQPDVFAEFSPKVMARDYDPQNAPISDKAAITVGMAMTEKQGGSDVRANSTRAFAVMSGGPGCEYELVGHKYFVSAPMSDAFLVLAQSESGLSCFFLPRWRPDGTRNAMQLQRLKNKMGNVANASAEAELRGAYAVMVGEEGRGVRTIIDMVAMTRFDCMIGSSAGMRQATAQAIHHCRHRSAFGRMLVDQPLMQNVLADLALESEAAAALTMRIAVALDKQQDDESESDLVRLCTAVGKYWICKRTPGHSYEAMECIGGSGVMEDSIMPRLFRESPVNAIWEGSGNIQCLDLLRVIQKNPRALQVFFDEIGNARGGNDHLDKASDSLEQQFADASTIEYRARSIVERMAVILQAALLVQHAPDEVANAFCESRLAAARRYDLYGSLAAGTDFRAIIDRAFPAV